MSGLNLTFPAISNRAAPLDRIVVDVSIHDVTTAENDQHAQWIIQNKLREAGVPIAPLLGVLARGTLTYFDFADRPVRRFIWEDNAC